MREIKFRIFDKRVGMGFMSQDDGHFYITPKGSVWDVNENVEITESAIVMQYTGLKDMNDIEIYEGDVVKLQYGEAPTVGFVDGGHDVIDGWKEEVVGGITYERGAFMIGEHLIWSAEAMGFDYSLEVLGNIYEHPHLLEVNE